MSAPPCACCALAVVATVVPSSAPNITSTPPSRERRRIAVFLLEFRSSSCFASKPDAPEGAGALFYQMGKAVALEN
jgi:hypothetical protein